MEYSLLWLTWYTRTSAKIFHQFSFDLSQLFRMVSQRFFVFYKLFYLYLLDRLLVLVNLSFHSKLFFLLMVTVAVISLINVTIIFLVAIIAFPIIKIIIAMVITASISTSTFSLLLFPFSFLFTYLSLQLQF